MTKVRHQHIRAIRPSPQENNTVVVYQSVKTIGNPSWSKIWVTLSLLLKPKKKHFNTFMIAQLDLQ